MNRTDWTPEAPTGIAAEMAPFFKSLAESGYTICSYTDFGQDFSVENSSGRSAFFIRRGRGRRGNRGFVWETLLYESGVQVRLQYPLQTPKHSCIVVVGEQGVRDVCRAWLEGGDVESVACATPFFDRIGMTPLSPKNGAEPPSDA